MMDLKVALGVFRQLEAHRYDGDDGKSVTGERMPIFDVRLDAGTNRDEDRTYRVRVATGALGEVDGETWQMVVDVAVEHGLSMVPQNAAMELF